MLPPPAPTGQLPALVLPAETGEFVVPPIGATVPLEGPRVIGLEPSPAGAAYLLLESTGSVNIRVLDRIPDPTELAPLPDRFIVLNSWDISLDAKGAYFCRDFADMGDIDAASVTVLYFDGNNWVPLPADRIIVDLTRHAVCGKISGTPYLIGGFAIAMAFPSLPQCPVCDAPGAYGICTDAKQSRLTHICSAGTNYTCQSMVESRYCIPPELMPYARAAAVTIIAFAAMFLLWWIWARERIPIKETRFIQRKS